MTRDTCWTSRPRAHTSVVINTRLQYKGQYSSDSSKLLHVARSSAHSKLISIYMNSIQVRNKTQRKVLMHI